MPAGEAVTYDLSPPVEVNVGAGRFLHGPTLVETADGDWLCAYQNSLDDPGHDSVIAQSRSRDCGRTWTYEGVVYDERAQGIGARNPCFARLEDGTILMAVQRTYVGTSGRGGPFRHQNAEPARPPLRGSHLTASADGGRTYSLLGPVDRDRPERHHGAIQPPIRHRGRLLWPAIYCLGDLMIYGSTNGLDWRADCMAATLEEVRPHCGEDLWEDHEFLSYPSLIERADGSLLFVGHYAGSAENFARLSTDGGRTWSDLWMLDGVRMRHAVPGRLGSCLVLAGAQMLPQRYPAFFVSADEGRTWLGPYRLNEPEKLQAGYTAILPVSGGELFIAFSQGTGRHAVFDIVGVFLRSVRVK